MLVEGLHLARRRYPGRSRLTPITYIDPVMDGGSTAARIVIGLILWTIVANVIVWWTGVWSAVWDRFVLKDPSAVMAEVFLALAITSGLWLLGAIGIVAAVLVFRRGSL